MNRTHGRGADGDDRDAPRYDAAGEECGHARLSRRGLLAGGAAAGTAALAGCLGGLGGGGEAAPDPVTLTEEDTCEVCGMVIPQHPGPSTEIFYAENDPGHPPPADFCSTWEAFKYDFQRQDRGWKRTAMYVTDYSSVDYDVFTDGGQKLVSRHLGADTFAEASEVTFVVGSSVKGTMGKDLLAFSERADAEAFADEHGGDLVELGDVTETMIAQLGRR